MDAFLSREDIISFLKSTPLFSKMQPPALKELASYLRVVPLESEQLLIEQDKPGNSLFIVESGRLKASTMVDGKFIKIAEIGRGEIVGEIALFTGLPRTATIRSIRDSILLELDAKHFEKFFKKYPDDALLICKFCISRLASNKPPHSSNISAIAFIPAAINPLFSDFMHKITNLLSMVDSTLILSAKTFNQLYGKDAAQVAFSDIENFNIISWLHQQESNYRYVIYIADQTLTQWTLRCLRQADRIIKVGLYGEKPDLNEMEANIPKKGDHQHAEINLVLLHPTDNSPTQTSMWLSIRDIKEHHHIRLTNHEDFLKFIRYLTDKSTGLVLAGGGAPSFAYAGLFRALEELDIKFDFVGGTSGGAYMAALYATGRSSSEMIELIKYHMKHYKIWSNYTFPFLSVFSGKSLNKNIIHDFDKLNIEDLWIKYFCVSTNLTKRNIHIHHQGLLNESVRASVSLPGIFPPMIDNDGDVYIDGGLLNNFPINIMRNRIGNGKILAVKFNNNLSKKYEPIDGVKSGWKILWDHLFKSKNNRQKLPTIFNVIVSSMSLKNQDESNYFRDMDCLIELNFENIRILDLRNIDKLTDKTYQYCLKQLQQNPQIFNL